MPDFNTLESLTVTRETGERLKAAGFPQDTAFAWRHSKWQTVPPPGDATEVCMAESSRFYRICAAPTLEEVLRELPACPMIEGERYRASLAMWSPSEWMVSMEQPVKHFSIDFAQHSSPAEAAALLWLSLHADGLLAPAGTDGEGR